VKDPFNRELETLEPKENKDNLKNQPPKKNDRGVKPEKSVILITAGHPISADSIVREVGRFHPFFLPNRALKNFIIARLTGNLKRCKFLW
jgi:hypothetical protein